jgi:uncharacterized phiE125 gp8 family phage protein
MSTITLAQAKEHLEVGHTGQDTVVQMLIDGAEDWVERHCGVLLTSQSVTDDLDGGTAILWPRHKPVTAVSSITDLKATADTITYLLVGDSQIWRADDDGNRLDSKWGAGHSRWRAAYTAGFSTVPAGLKGALLQLIYRAYHRRGGVRSQTGGGQAVGWAELVGSEVLEQLRPFIRKRSVS